MRDILIVTVLIFAALMSYGAASIGEWIGSAAIGGAERARILATQQQEDELRRFLQR